MSQLRIIFYLFFILALSPLNGQDSIVFTSILSANTSYFVREIDGKAFHFGITFINNQASGSKLFYIENEKIETVTTIDKINDSIDCKHLIDFWKTKDDYLFLAYGQNKFSKQNNISLCKFDLSSKKISLISQVPIEIYLEDRQYRVKDLVVNGNKEFVLLEFEKNISKPIRFLNLKLINNKIETKSYYFDTNNNPGGIYDLFYDETNEIYFIKGGLTLYALNSDFEKIFSNKYKVKIDEVTYSLLDVLIIAQDANVFTFIERNNDLKKLNNYLSIRKNVVKDSLEISADVINYKHDIDSYVVRKIIKDNYNLLFFSRSSINQFDKNYGFNIVIFDKSGKILREYSIDTERPVVIYDIDINDEGIIHGVGDYSDYFDPVSFIYKPKNIIANIDSKSGLIEWASILKSNFIQFNSIELKDSYKEVESFCIYDINGRMIMNSKTAQQIIDIQILPAGSYIFRYTINGIDKSEKFVKN